MTPWLLIPLIAGLIGGITNWIAVMVALHPARPRYFGPICIQGLIPRKAEKLVYKFTEQLLPDIISTRQLLSGIQPDRVAEDCVKQLGDSADDLINAVLAEINPEHWSSLRQPVRNLWISRMRPTLPGTIRHIFVELQKDPHRYLDLPALSSVHMREHPELLSDLLWRTGRVEFRFIEWSGAVVGAFLGLFMALIWISTTSPLCMAAGGAVIGAGTNWLALLMVFRPVKPLRLGGLRFQGLVYRRQHEVSHQLADMVLEQTLHFGYMLCYLATHSPCFRGLCQEAISAQLNAAAGGSAQLVTLALGARNLDEAVERMAAAMVNESPRYLADVQLGGDDKATVRHMLQQQIADLPSATYGRVMHHMIGEDEPLLILAGGITGAICAYAGALLI